MTAKDIDVLGLGNAIVDVLSQADDRLIEELGLAKGSMTLIDQERALELYEQMGPATEISGGSGANTIAGLASFGSKSAFLGKVAKDQLGDIFRHDLKSMGVHFEGEPLDQGPATARCLVLVTPDAQRTMSTYLGACVHFGPQDVPEELVERSRMIYLEGYLWDPPQAKEAFLKACSLAKAAGSRVALSLSDGFCVDRHRSSFMELIEQHVDVLFANEQEITSLFETTDFDAAVEAASKRVQLTAITRGAHGSVLTEAGLQVRIPAKPVERVIDTTGAGDLYAAGVLFGLCRGTSLQRMGELGALAAAQVLTHFGARPRLALESLL